MGRAAWDVGRAAWDVRGTCEGRAWDVQRSRGFERVSRGVGGASREKAKTVEHLTATILHFQPFWERR